MTNHAAAANDDDAGNVGHDGSDDGDEDAVGVGLVERICWNWGWILCGGDSGSDLVAWSNWNTLQNTKMQNTQQQNCDHENTDENDTITKTVIEIVWIQIM